MRGCQSLLVGACRAALVMLSAIASVILPLTNISMLTIHEDTSVHWSLWIQGIRNIVYLYHEVRWFAEWKLERANIKPVLIVALCTAKSHVSILSD